jgi:hypothetical protein
VTSQLAVRFPSFTVYNLTLAVTTPTNVFVSDLNSDGRVDVLSASSGDGKIAWYRNMGGSVPSFAALTIATGVTSAKSVVAADVDEDGIVDAVYCGTTALAWSRQAPLGTWTSYTIASSSYSNVLVADVDSDGLLDVVAALSSSILWYANGGGAVPSWTGRSVSSNAFASSLLAVDVDNDGRTDVVHASRTYNKISWHKNGGGLPVTWTELVVSVVVQGPISVSAADIDSDGLVDLLSVGSSTVCWYRNLGGSPPAWARTVIVSSITTGTSVLSVDIDGDGRMDVLSGSSGDNTVSWYRNGGGSAPVWTTSFISTTALGVASVSTGDFDGDGFVDVVTANPSQNSVVWFDNSGLCAAGMSGAQGWSGCVPCTAGRFSPAQGATSCSACPGGTLSAANSFACSACAAGWACPAGSSNASAVPCATGQYAVAGSATCLLCPPGTFGNTTHLTSAACSGLCDPGFRGSVGGLSVSTCSGPCGAGYACPPGTLHPWEPPALVILQVWSCARVCVCDSLIFLCLCGLQVPSLRRPAHQAGLARGLRESVATARLEPTAALLRCPPPPARVCVTLDAMATRLVGPLPYAASVAVGSECTLTNACSSFGAGGEGTSA